MTDHRRRRWFQLSLKSLFLLVLLVATFFAGYTLRAKQDEAEKLHAEQEAQRLLLEKLDAEQRARAALLEYIGRVQPPVGPPSSSQNTAP
jgi:hypothetical protein